MTLFSFAFSNFCWPKIGLENLLSSPNERNSVAWIFMMKNLHGWNDNKDGQNQKESKPINIQIVRDSSTK